MVLYAWWASSKSIQPHVIPVSLAVVSPSLLNCLFSPHGYHRSYQWTKTQRDAELAPPASHPWLALASPPLFWQCLSLRDFWGPTIWGKLSGGQELGVSEVFICLFRETVCIHHTYDMHIIHSKAKAIQPPPC